MLVDLLFHPTDSGGDSSWPSAVWWVLAALLLLGAGVLAARRFRGTSWWRRSSISRGPEAAPPGQAVPPASGAVARPSDHDAPNATPSDADASGIFISYRREDEPNFAGRLYDRLVSRFGRDRVFMDVDTIDLGVDFAEVIDQSLARCPVTVVVIGRSWLGVTDADGEPRLSNPDDYVRMEIEKALRTNTRVIPVLVEGAAIPKSTQLPESLASLARRNGIAMSHESFGSDAERLIGTLERILEPEAGHRP